MARWLDGLGPGWSSLLVFVVLVAIYLPTADFRARARNVDAVATAVPAWQLATHGNLTLDDLPANPWYLERSGRVVSNRPPGAIFFAVPFYLLWRTETPTLVPATAAAVIAAASAMALLHLALRSLVRPSQAVPAALVGGLATATWPISADQLWQHGPAQLWLAVGLLLLARSRYAGAGAGFALALVTRPPTALMPLVAGVHSALRTRSWRPATRIGVTSLAGLGLLVLYNKHVFGTLSPVGGYGSRTLERLQSTALGEYLDNLAGTLWDPANGLLVWSPFLLLLVPGLGAAWKRAPGWVRSAALAGLAYLLIHAKMNRFSGGLAFDYRYPLEALMMAAPLLALSYRDWVAGQSMRESLFWSAVGVSVFLQGSTAVLLHCTSETPFGTCSFL